VLDQMGCHKQKKEKSVGGIKRGEFAVDFRPGG